MTVTTILALFSSMIILALIPGPAVFTVMARSMSSGFRHAAVTVAGIIFGDYIFIALSVLGLAAIADITGSFFIVLKYAGSAYLIWLAISLWRSGAQSHEVQGIKELSFMSNFMAGLLTTLGNPKAILFYIGFFPAFLDLSAISVFDLTLIMIIATISVSSVMLSYAWAACKARKMLSGKGTQKAISRTASAVMAGSGVFLAAKA